MGGALTTVPRERVVAVAATSVAAVAMLILGWGCAADDAVHRLHEAQRFAGVFGGLGAGVTEEALAFQILLRDPRSPRFFTILAADARSTPAGRLYGLCGLYHVNRLDFTSRRESLKGATDVVHVSLGCLGFDRTLREILSDPQGSFERECGYLKMSPTLLAQTAVFTLADRLTKALQSDDRLGRYAPLVGRR
jgi:hypothetical protein